jgi:hypothetical protein
MYLSLLPLIDSGNWLFVCLLACFAFTLYDMIRAGKERKKKVWAVSVIQSDCLFASFALVWFTVLVLDGVGGEMALCLSGWLD